MKKLKLLGSHFRNTFTFYFSSNAFPYGWLFEYPFIMFLLNFFAPIWLATGYLIGGGFTLAGVSCSHILMWSRLLHFEYVGTEAMWRWKNASEKNREHVCLCSSSLHFASQTFFISFSKEWFRCRTWLFQVRGSWWSLLPHGQIGHGINEDRALV